MLVLIKTHNKERFILRPASDTPQNSIYSQNRISAADIGRENGMEDKMLLNWAAGSLERSATLLWVLFLTYWNT